MSSSSAQARTSLAIANNALSSSWAGVTFRALSPYVGFMKDDSDKTYSYTEAEAEARREAALKVMLATPHKPHKVGNLDGKSSKGK